MARVQADAATLRRLWGGFWSSRVILTANNYRVFEYLKSPKTAAGLAGILATERRATEILLDALTGLGLLKKNRAGYRNTALSRRFLISESPFYQGDILRHADVLWKNWSGLDEVLKTGLPHHVAHNHPAFIKGMHNLAVMKARKVISTIGMRGAKKALDLGGGPGTYAIEMARRGVSVTLFDRPETVAIARSVVRKSGARAIGFLSGDFLYDAIGKGYDLIFISQVLHSCSAEEALQVISKAGDALKAGGRVVVQEFYLENDRAHPAQSALFSVNMLVNTQNGRCYSPAEIRKWFSAAGLKDVRDTLLDDTVLVFGKKEA